MTEDTRGLFFAIISTLCLYLAVLLVAFLAS